MHAEGLITEIRDNNGNVATIAYWRSESAARASLKTLKNCQNCIDCSGCAGCSRCEDCADCTGCSGCADCTGCSGCTDCTGCSGCTDCTGCSRCEDCADCTGCSRCVDKKGEACDHTQPIIPVIPKIHQAVYAAARAPGALNMNIWHACDTTHCRAGWVVALAGHEGKTLERYWGTPHAAWLIYKASDPNIEGYPDFYTENELALADMKRLAEKEAL